MPAAGEHHPAFEEYCECIFELREDDLEVIQARIAERLQVSRPAVSEMMKRLEAEGLITSDDGIRSRPGRALAETVVRRHRLAERFLTDVLQLSWAEAHHEAGKWEHVISESVEKAMVELLGDPDDVPARQSDPRNQLRRARLRAALDDRRGRRVHRRAGSPKNSSSNQDSSSSSRHRRSSPETPAW